MNLLGFLVSLFASDPKLDRVVRFLRQFGYLHPEHSPSTEALTAALARMQHAHGMLPTGTLTPETEAVMLAPRCGCADVESLATLAARWRKSRLTYRVDSVPPLLTRAEWDAAIDAAFASWAAVLGVAFTRTTGTPDIRIFAAPIDGPGKVLAQAQLADGSDGQLYLQLDSTDRWASAASAGILPLNVLAHEIGHTLGLDHSQVTTALMAPYYSPTVNRPQENDDISRAVGLGYPRAGQTPAPPPPPPPPAGPQRTIIVIEHTGPIKITQQAA